MEKHAISKIKDKAIELLTRRDHSQKELLAKLLMRKYPKEFCLRVIDELKAGGLINDIRFATNLIEQRIHAKPMGPEGFVSLLRKKGISRADALAVVDSVMADSGIDERELARKVLDRRLSGRASDAGGRKRVAALMIRRGFDPHLVRELMEEMDGMSEPVEVEVRRGEF